MEKTTMSVQELSAHMGISLPILPISSLMEN